MIQTTVIGGFYNPSIATYNRVVGGSSTTVNLTQTQGQSISLASGITAIGITLQLAKIGSPTDGLTVELLTGSETGTVIATSSLANVSILTSSYINYYFTFTSPVTLSGSTTYYIRITRSPDNQDTSNYVNVGGSGIGSVYTQGNGWYKYNNVWNVDTGDDLYFGLLLTSPPFSGRVSLPGYDCLTDTNLDHYSLYADVDNIMIKNLSRGLGTVAAAGTAGYTMTTINHGLGYIPFYMVYDNASQALGTAYQILNNQYNPFEVPPSISAADTQNVYVVNSNGGTTDPYAYEVFYDNMSSGTPSFTPSHYAITVSRPGKEASSTNPNDFIMHSDLNTYKILGSGTVALSIPNGSIGTFAHGATINNPVESFVFIKETGKYPTFLTGGARHQAFDGSFYLTSWADPTNIYIGAFGASGTFIGTAVYYIMGQGANNTTPHGEVMAVTKAGVDLGTATNPDNFNFHSAYPTLKYATSGTYTMANISTHTLGTVVHNLGYTPFYVGFVNDISNFNIFNGNSEPVYAIIPYYLGKSTMGNPHRDIGAFMYADQNNLYFDAWFDTNASGTYSFNFYYKIFKNNLGI